MGAFFYGEFWMNRNRVTGILFIMLCILLWFYLIPEYIKGHDQSIFPKLLVIFIAIPSLLMIFRKKQQSNEAPVVIMNVIRSDIFKKTAILLSSYCVYLVSISYIGFFVPSIVFGSFYMYFFGEKRFSFMFLSPLCILIAIYFIIVYTLKYPLPSGIIF